MSKPSRSQKGKSGSAPHHSPHRYTGGKRRFVEYLDRFLQLNELRPHLFVEPFAGGASVSLHVLEHGLAEHVIIADRDPLVAGFWKTVFHPRDVEWLIEQIRTIPVTLEQWREFKDSNPTTDRERALACLFLNRTSFSGILHARSGPIGGFSQESAYKIDCRFSRDMLIRRIRDISAHRNRVWVWNLPWKSTISRVERGQGPDSVGTVLYYCDPPFFNKADLLYRFSFKEEDHVALRDSLLSLKSDWLLSYDVADDLYRIWEGSRSQQAHVELLYQMPQRTAKEAVLSNLELPTSRAGHAPVEAGGTGQVKTTRERDVPVLVAGD
jgi:DNA adenine methylase